MRSVLSAALLITATVMSSPLTAEELRPVYDDEIKVIRHEELRYPIVALSGGTQGVVVINVTLADDGSVASAAIVSGNRFLVLEALENAKKWRFAPNRTKSAVIVYDFVLDDSACGQAVQARFKTVHVNMVSIRGCAPAVNR